MTTTDFEATACNVCLATNDDRRMLLCDNCDGGYHTYCIGLTRVPRGTWYCVRCKDALARSSLPEQTPYSVGSGSRVHVYQRVSTPGQNNPEYGRVGLGTQN